MSSQHSNTRRLPHRPCLVVILVTASMLVTSCGAASPERSWAEEVCSLTLRWGDRMNLELKSLERMRAARGRDVRSAMLKLAVRSKRDTESFVAEIHALQPPKKPDGRAAQEWLDYYAERSLETVVSVEQSLRRLPIEPTRRESALGRQQLSRGIAEAVLLMAGSVELLRKRYPRWEEPFAHAESCSDLEEAFD